MTTTDAKRTLTRELEVPFTLTGTTDEEGDGLTLEGYGAVFNRIAHIDDRDGVYDEVILPGAFKRTLNANPRPPLMFNHGRHPLIGMLPIGAILDLHEDPRGLFVRARLFDNWMIEPLRDAIREEAIAGMSIRMELLRNGYTMTTERGARLRTIRETKLHELGPVVFPAYADATCALRSIGTVVSTVARELPAPIVQVAERRAPQDLVTEAIETFWGLDAASDVYVFEFSEHRAVFAVIGSAHGTYPGLWQVGFTYDGGAGTVTLDGAPETVQATVPRSAPKNHTTRGDDTFSVIVGAVEDAVEAWLGIDDYTSDVWIVDITDTWAVFSVCGALEDFCTGYWQVDYTFDATTITATVTEPSPVKRTYSQRDQTATWSARTTDLGTSTEPAPSTSTEPAGHDTATRETAVPLTHGQQIRRIQMERRGIALPKE